MQNRRYLKVAFLFSVGVHSIVIAPWPNVQFNLPQKPEIPIEVTYFMIPEPANVEISEQKAKIAMPKKPEKTDSEPQKKEIITLEKPREKPSETIVEARSIPEPEIVPRRSIKIQSAPDLEGDISYMSYSQLVRERMRRYLYANYSNSMGEGDIVVSFVLRSNGILKNLSIINEESVPNIKLRRACLKSIYQASPFKRFPKELAHPEITFKVTITFKKD